MSSESLLQEELIPEVSPQGNRFGGRLPWKDHWQVRTLFMPDGGLKTVGVKEDEGPYHEIGENEEFGILRHDDGTQEAVVFDLDGNRLRVLGRSDEVESVSKATTGRVAEVLAEAPEFDSLNEKFKISAQYLNRLDCYAEGVSIDPDSGKISVKKADLPPLKEGALKEKYQIRFAELIQKFKNRNEASLVQFKAHPGILDAQLFMGAIIVTYDSSKKTPSHLRGVSFFESDPTGKDNKRGAFEQTSEEFLGLAFVDINKEKRLDGASPSLSAAHELHHYALSISDYLISLDESLNMQSAYRKGRSGALYGQHSGRITTAQALLHDTGIYSALSGRKFDQAEDSRIELQSKYLDELHSSFLQRKPNWFVAQENVYAGSSDNKGKHWELVGGHPDDIKRAKRLFGFLQGFFILEKLAESWQKSVDQGVEIGKGQQAFISECTQEFDKVGSLIGVSRTIKQAEALVAESWDSFMKKYPKLATHKDFLSIITQWENGNIAVENLRSILLST